MSIGNSVPNALAYPLWRLVDRAQSGIRIASAEGLTSLVVHASVVHGPQPLTEYLVHTQFGFPRTPSREDLAFVWVDPQLIEFDLRSRPLPLVGDRAVIGRGTGFWDRSTIPFDENPVVRAINTRFGGAVDWEETAYFNRAVRRAERGLPTWNDCQTRRDIERRCNHLDALYASMEAEGYKTQEELFREDASGDRSPYVRTLGGFVVPDELRVGIDRDGRLLRLVNGRHRVAIARLLGFERVPAIVQLHHADWVPDSTEIPGVEPAPDLAAGTLVGSTSPSVHPFESSG